MDNEMVLENARFSEQRKKMQECLDLGICPFCPENFLKYHDAPIEINGNFWLITKNDYPYKGAKYQYLAISKGPGINPATKNHIVKITDVHPVAWSELFSKLFPELLEKLEIKGGSILMRFGDPKANGSTIDHLHLHLIVGQDRNEKSEWLLATVGYKN